MAQAATLTTTQCQLTQLGGPFKFADEPTPSLATNEVLISQRVIALNLVDVKQRDIGIGIQKWPHVLGIEGAGVVESVGSAVTHVNVGDEVMGCEGSGANESQLGGSFQTRVAVPDHLVAKKPSNVSLVDVASLPICFVTAVSAIFKGLELSLPFLPFLRHPSKEENVPSSVLILGGSSATGAAAIQLLRMAYPALPIVVTASPKHHARMRELGATRCVDYRSPTVVADLKAASPDAAGIDAVIDCVGAGADQTDISDVFKFDSSKRYAAVVTRAPWTLPDGVQKVDLGAWDMFQMDGGKELIPSLTKLVEDGAYRVSLPVKVVGSGLEKLPDVMDEVTRVSGEKAVVTI